MGKFNVGVIGVGYWGRKIVDEFSMLENVDLIGISDLDEKNREMCRDRFGVKMAVATGGTLARRIVEQARPGLILAVACPRDLSLGMMDVYPIPVVGQLNVWREQECIDTWVDTAELERTLERLLSRSGRPREPGTR